jgi:rod shape-determining protein MreC
MARSRTFGTVGGVVVLLLTLWIFRSLGWLTPITRPLSHAFSTITAPLHDAATADRSPDDDPTTAAMSKEELRRKFERASAENARLRQAVEEVDELKSALAYRERFKDSLLAARVISSASDPIDASVLIDRGSDDGVSEGQAVVVGDGILIGKVTEVGTHTARIRLLTDSRSAVAVAVQTAEGTLGVLQGDRGLSLRIALIPQTEVLTPGDVVITSGLEPGIRRGLLVGTIEKIGRDNQDPFQTASVLPFLDSQHPSFVQVLAAQAGGAEPVTP